MILRSQTISVMRILPSEIVRLIVEEVDDNQSLVVLSTTSKQLQMEAERLLYRSLTEEDGTKSYQCLSIVGKSHRRAAYVLTYHVYTTLHRKYSLNRGMWILIKRTLQMMVNLKELAFRDMIGGRPYLSVFPKKCIPRLEKFVWSVGQGNLYHYSTGPEEQSYVSQALKFLEGQPQLQLLHWMPSSHTEQPCPDSFFPKLDTLIGDLETIRTYLPGRDSVTTLQWFTGVGTRFPSTISLEALRQVFVNLSPRLRRIKQLSIQPLIERRSDETHFLRPIIPHLHSLETLWLLSLSELGINEVLPRLSKLKKLIVLYSSLANRQSEEIDMQLVFSRVKSLEFLYMGQKNTSGGKWCKYNKWARESVRQGDMAPKEEVLKHFADL